MPKKTTIIRRAKGKENPYAQISRQALQDKKLSWQATGMLSYLLSLPITWEINLQDLINRKPNGKHSTRTILNELIENGYIQKNIIKNEKKQFVRFEYIVYENPFPIFQEMAIREETNISAYHLKYNQTHEDMLKAELEAHHYAYTATDYSIMPRNKVRVSYDNI